MILLVLSIYIGTGLHYVWTLEGNVCPEEERLTVNVTQLVLTKTTIRNYKWCLNVPPRCSFYTEEQRYVPEVVEKEDVRVVNKCCPGFKTDETNSTCVLDCSQCATNECDMYNNCICPSGFWGSNCEKGCPDFYWGPNCIQKCSCIKGDCNPITGYCNCPPGWKGSRCDKQDEVWKTEVNSSHTPSFTKTRNAISTDLGTLVKSITKHSERTHYPTFQKYFTFVITTLSSPSKAEIESSIKKIDDSKNQLSFSTSNPMSPTESITNYEPSETSNTSTEVSKEPVVTVQTITQESRTKQDQTFINNLRTDNVISVTQASNVIMKEKVMEDIEVSVTSPQTVSSEGNWLNDQSNGDIERNLSTRRKETHINNESNNSHLIFSIGAVAGILATIILIISVIIYTSQNYKRTKLTSSLLGISRNIKNGNADGGISSVAIYTRSVFHAPLPDPPTFENPVFTTPIESISSGGTLEAHVICSLHLQNESNNRKDTRNIDAFYDHPPSTGSYRAASIPEPPDQNLQIVSSISKEHLYDEIPCWKQRTALTNQITIATNEKALYYANTTSSTNIDSL